MNMPKLPRELHSGTVGEVNVRLMERKYIMEDAFPGTKFSPCGSNLLGVKAGKKIGYPGIGMPRAIYHKSNAPVDNETVAKIARAADRWQGRMSCTYTTLAIAADVDFETLFSAVTKMMLSDEFTVTMTTDRLGYNTAARIIRNLYR